MVNKKIKICYVTSVDITLRFILLNHMKFLREQGYNISAVCSQGKWLEDVQKEGIKVKTIELKRKISPLSDLAAFFKLYFYFRKEKFDIIHTHTPKPEVYGQIAAKLAGVPVIIDTLHGFDLPADVSFFGRKIFFLLKKSAAKCSDLIFSVNKKNIETLVNEKICSPSIIKYFGNGIDTKRFDLSRFSEEFIAHKKSEIGIKPGRKVMGIVARLVEEKGYLDLFNAFKLILNTFPDTILLVVGPLEPEKGDAIKTSIVKEYGIENNVIFLGERADVDEIYPLMDVFILPSHREGLPYTILEASSTGKPVVATNVGGCPEAIDDKKTGLLVNPKRPEELAEAVMHLFSNPDQALAMGREGRKKVLAQFDENIVFERIKTEYIRLFKEKVGLKYKICCVVSVDITLKFMLLSQLKFLQDQGYDVHAICSPGRWVQDIRNHGIKVKTMLVKRKMSPITDMILFSRMFFYFKKEKFDIVHTHTPKPEIYGQIAAKLASVPIIFDTLHGIDLPVGVSSLGRAIFIFLEKIAARCSDLIFSISNAVIDAATKKKICEPQVLKYLGRDIDINKFNPQRFSEDFIFDKKKKLGIAPGKKVIGIVARLVAEKGYLDLFEAIKEVVVLFPGIVLLVVGQKEPEKGDAIKTSIVKEYGIENNVIFLGERADTEELYSLMDIFVLPTHREGLGAVILEASAMQRPVIATNIGGCPEAVDDGKTGILVPLKNPKKLAEAIMFLLSNPARAKEMGILGREKILKEFNEKLIFDILGREYQRLIEEKIP